MSDNIEGEVITITGAKLVYKREDEGGNGFNELWIMDNDSDVSKKRNKLLSRTNIKNFQSRTRDGLQSMADYSVGDVYYLEINGVLD